MNRLRTRYEIAFALTALGLAGAALFAFSRIGPAARAPEPTRPWARPLTAIAREGTESRLSGARAIAATDADYRRFEAEDADWRRRHAQLPDLFVLKRRALEERVFLLNTSGRRGAAIAELERWTSHYPSDRQAVLWLARLLNEAGRTNESLAKYRELLSVSERR